MSTNKTFKLVLASLLCAIGTLIPIISPVKIIIEPASFTLASHVAIFIAMFISPMVTIAVVIGTSLGFFLYGFPLVVVIRAASHIVFAVIGAFYLAKHPTILHNKYKNLLFIISISIIHGLLEVISSMPFYFNGSMSDVTYQKGFLVSVILLVGVGTVIHSCVDYFIALMIYKPLSKMRQVREVSAVGKI